VKVSGAVEGALADLFARMQGVGNKFRSIAAVGGGSIFTYDYLVVFWSKSLSMSPAEALAGLTGCRLVGAFESVSVDAPDLVGA